MTDHDKQYYFGYHKCAERYRDMMMDKYDVRDMPEHEKELWDFIMEFMFATRDRKPLLKISRWLGYIQGVLIERGYTTVTIERDWTRPLFRPLDFAE
jgi:hypothetical protein